MSDYYSLLEFEQLKAIQCALEPSLESAFRIKCRQYSDRFKTPLHLVMDLNPAFVLQHLYEDQYSVQEVEEDLQNVLELLYKVRDPNYEPMDQQEIEGLVDAVLNKELARYDKKNKKAPTQQTIREDIKKVEQKPKSGGMNFDDLGKSDEKAETNGPGFED
jgi:hypothetical protein